MINFYRKTIESNISIFKDEKSLYKLTAFDNKMLLIFLSIIIQIFLSEPTYCSNGNEITNSVILSKYIQIHNEYIRVQDMFIYLKKSYIQTQSSLENLEITLRKINRLLGIINQNLEKNQILIKYSGSFFNHSLYNANMIKINIAFEDYQKLTEILVDQLNNYNIKSKETYRRIENIQSGYLEIQKLELSLNNIKTLYK
jgi:hypothetical protein